MYPTDLKNGTLKLNPFQTNHNIMLKTIQNLCYNKSSNGFNMTSPFLVDNILHQQKTVNFHNQFLNQQLENYMQSQSYSRENSPDVDEAKTAENEEDNRTDEVDKGDDEDSKSRDEDFSMKNETGYYNHDFYNRNEDRREREEKEVLNIPNLSRRCHCGTFDCPPFACKKSGIRRLEELEKRFNLHSYQENSGDDEKDRFNTEDLVRSCEDYGVEQKKPLLKFSVSAILGNQEDAVKNNVNGKLLS